MSDELLGLEGSCDCGEVKLKTSAKAEAWGVFICHCSMCPDHSYTDTKVGSGVGWLAVPRDEDLYTSASRAFVEAKRSSEFAQRGFCRLCKAQLTIQYDCEPFTTWICIDRFACGIGRERILALTKNKAHIHCHTIEEGAEGRGEDGIPAFHSWEPWLPDPCRPEDCEDPIVCTKCFQQKGADHSPSRLCGPDGCSFARIRWEDLKARFIDPSE